MSEQNPVWRKAFDAVAERATPVVSDLYSSEAFATLVGGVTQAQRGIQRRVERTSRHLLHELNLPAGSDVTRLLRELSRLRAEVAELGRKIDEQRGVFDAALAAKSSSAARKSTA